MQFRPGVAVAVAWPAAAALIQPLAWELPHAAGVALKRKKERKREITPNSILRVIANFMFNFLTRYILHLLFIQV